MTLRLLIAVITSASLGLLPLKAFADVGEFVSHKFTWLLDNVEVIGIVHNIGGDSIDIIPDANYKHLILYMRGNNPLPWFSKGTPGVLHLETYPLSSSDINRSAPWSLPKKPDDVQFQVKRRDGTSQPLNVGDRIRVVGRWVIDHHPEKCFDPEKFTPPEPARCRSLGLLRVGQVHMELHPFQWDNIQLIEPATSTDVVSTVVSLAAPLHEEQYLGDWKWFANEVAGVAGKVFLDRSDDPNFPNFSRNFHTSVGTRVELDPPPRPTGTADWRLVWTETVTKLGQGMQLADVRTVRQRSDGGLIIEATIIAKGANGALASINDPANDRWVFQARYDLWWTSSKLSRPSYLIPILDYLLSDISTVPQPLSLPPACRTGLRCCGTVTNNICDGECWPNNKSCPWTQ